ncbi:glycosyltransferase family 2 protein [Agromyces italicus]|uniref:glycosyltransferase family 2 protein n=1 Tax=Agromyces italicus TaxID=279572 RepID=UPI000410E76E|nr:glycosyltransferase family 2 protein [Agromyces italicus]
MRLNHLAVVMPAYNEAAGIAGFLTELDEHLAPLTHRLDLVVIDDRSTDATATVLSSLAGELTSLRSETADVNRGHGPTALAAYRTGLGLGPELIVHIDGDGQFSGADVARLVEAALDTGADVVHGVRTGRTDPWFRRVLTAGVGGIVTVVAGRRIPDVNTPLRAYRPQVLTTLVTAVPADALVPHVHFSLAEARRGLAVRYLRVASLPRRGGDEQGTMWAETDAPARRAPMLPPRRLRTFARAAAGELWRVSLSPRRAR